MSGKTWCKPCDGFACERDRNGVWRCPIHGVTPNSGVRVVLERTGNAGPYLMAEIEAVHSHGCAATVWGKKHGPCNCGGDGLIERFIAEHADDPWRGVADSCSYDTEGRALIHVTPDNEETP